VQLELTLAGPGPGAALVEAVPGRAGPSGASGESGAAAALRAMAELCRRAGAVHVGHAPGAAPCAPILRGALFEAAHLLLEDGWTPGALDAAAVAAGLPAGPCAQEDALGLGVGARARAAAAAWRDPRRRYAAVADRLHGAGRTGRRAGAGFHRYAGAFDLPQRDPAADALLADARREAGRARRTDLSAEAACQALLRAVAQAARLCVAGGTAGDVVDLVAVEAGAFPARLGGPLAFGGSGGDGAAGALSRAGPRR
jgi:3-hydroxyacyl-CoA dehydrogenase